jgi:hypothetical protein
MGNKQPVVLYEGAKPFPTDGAGWHLHKKAASTYVEAA